MTHTSHTPGPWTIAYYGGEKPHRKQSVTINCPSGMVAEMNLTPVHAELDLSNSLTDYGQRVYAEQQANARLIAQAPTTKTEVLDYLQSAPPADELTDAELREAWDIARSRARARAIIDRIEGTE